MKTFEVKIKHMAFTFVILFYLCAAASAATVSLPRTGQTTCYDSTGATTACSGTGQDGDILSGAAWPGTRFTSTDSGSTVTDALTGLVWLQDGSTPATIACAGGTTGCVGGFCTGGQLTWLNAPNFPALEYIKCLNENSYLTYTDWRLPNVLEMESLMNLEQSNMVTWLNNASQGFSNVQSGDYWVSTTVTATPANAWCFYMVDGGLSDSMAKSGGAGSYVWPVRGGSSSSTAPLWRTGQTTCYNSTNASASCTNTGQDGDSLKGVAWPGTRFTDNGDGTVTDALTGLVWLKDASCDAIGTQSWQGALTAANALASGQCSLTDSSAAGDWRLPNRKEMLSLIDFSQSSPALQSGHPFTDVKGYYWTSDTAANFSANAWSVYVTSGNLGNFNDKDVTTLYVWPVRDPVITYSVTITKAGTGSGTVTSSPSGINCGSTCTYAFTGGASVTLTATADSGSTFTGWSGDTDCTDGNVTVNSGISCTATFTAQSSCTYTLSSTAMNVKRDASNGNTVTVTPSDSSCTWTSTSNADWITINSGSSGTGTGTVSFSTLYNPSENLRTGTITIGGQTLTVTQYGVEDTLSVNYRGDNNDVCPHRLKPNNSCGYVGEVKDNTTVQVRTSAYRGTTVTLKAGTYTDPKQKNPTRFCGWDIQTSLPGSITSKIIDGANNPYSFTITGLTSVTILIDVEGKDCSGFANANNINNKFGKFLGPNVSPFQFASIPLDTLNSTPNVEKLLSNAKPGIKYEANKDANGNTVINSKFEKLSGSSAVSAVLESLGSSASGSMATLLASLDAMNSSTFLTTLTQLTPNGSITTTEKYGGNTSLSPADAVSSASSSATSAGLKVVSTRLSLSRQSQTTGGAYSGRDNGENSKTITLTVPPSSTLGDIFAYTSELLVATSAMPDADKQKSFPLPVFSFTYTTNSSSLLKSQETARATEFHPVTFDFPKDVQVNRVYKYGPTPGNTTPHWYDFTCGTLPCGQITDTADSKRIILYLADGLLGDNDLKVNGSITDDVVFAYVESDEAGSGDTSYTVSTEVSGSGAGGVITPVGARTVKRGEDFSCTITPDPGYHIQNVVVNGASMGPITGYQALVAGDLNIKASFDMASVHLNNTPGSVTVNRGDTLTMSIGLDASQAARQIADWYVTVLTPSGKWYSLDAGSGKWREGLAASYQGALTTVNSFDVLVTKDLTPGEHLFCFGVDTTPNGVLDANSLHYECKKATVR